jgi:hypothetical protein
VIGVDRWGKAQLQGAEAITELVHPISIITNPFGIPRAAKSVASKALQTILHPVNTTMNGVAAVKSAGNRILEHEGRGDAVAASIVAAEKGAEYTNNAIAAVETAGGVAGLAEGNVKKLVKRPEPIQVGEVTTYEDFVDRSVVGDNIEGHELWQHSNLKAHGHASERLSTTASRENPVLALDKSVHTRISAVQRSRPIGIETPLENIQANAAILRDLSAAAESTINRLVELALEHAKRLGH